MRYNNLLIILLVSFVSFFQKDAFAYTVPSFDVACSEVRQPYALVICSDSQLIHFEHLVADLYEKIRDNLPEGPREEFIDNQVNWIHYINNNCNIPREVPDIGYYDQESINIAAPCMLSYYKNRYYSFENNNWRNNLALFESTLSIDDRKTIQLKLSNAGYYTGNIDARFGPKFRYALNLYQKNHNIASSEYVNEELLSYLGIRDKIYFAPIYRSQNPSYSPNLRPGEMPSSRNELNNEVTEILKSVAYCLAKRQVTSLFDDPLTKTFAGSVVDALAGRNPSVESVGISYAVEEFMAKLKRDGREKEANLLKDAKLAMCVYSGVKNK